MGRREEGSDCVDTDMGGLCNRLRRPEEASNGMLGGNVRHDACAAKIAGRRRDEHDGSSRRVGEAEGVGAHMINAQP